MQVDFLWRVAEVLTMECAGEFLGMDCDKHLFAYFRPIFPALSRTDRTLCARLV